MKRTQKTTTRTNDLDKLILAVITQLQPLIDAHLQRSAARDDAHDQLHARELDLRNKELDLQHKQHALAVAEHELRAQELEVELVARRLRLDEQRAELDARRAAQQTATTGAAS